MTTTQTHEHCGTGWKCDRNKTNFCESTIFGVQVVVTLTYKNEPPTIFLYCNIFDLTKIFHNKNGVFCPYLTLFRVKKNVGEPFFDWNLAILND